jgi:hypothetical protein
MYRYAEFISEVVDKRYRKSKGERTNTLSDNYIPPCKTNRLAFVLVATSAAPTSPSVLETDEPIGEPLSRISCCNSALWDSTAILLDRPATTIISLECDI